MSRPTDIERGARIAHDAATRSLLQPDLFPNTSPAPDYWRDIVAVATDQLTECAALNAAIRCERVR